MKRTLTLKPFLFLAACVGLTPSIQAGFQYNPRDLVLGFRQSGGTSELTVNAGPAANYYNLATGSSFTVSNVNLTLLNTAFSDVNNLLWSASADVRTNGDASYPINTLWVIAPRPDLNTQSTPWDRKSQFTQGNAGAQIDGIASGAVSYGGQIPTGPTNSTTGVVIPSGSIYSYGVFMGDSGNYLNKFQGTVEAATLPEFTSSGLAVRADLYELKPGTGPGTYLGFFEFNTNGVLTYKSGPSSTVIPKPQITDISRTGNTASITFTTTAGAQYSLRYTDIGGLGTPVSSWTVSGAPVAGDGSSKILTDTSASPVRFYSISAQ